MSRPVVLLSLCAAVACGGTSSDEPGMTREAYVAKANEICRRVDAEAAQVPEPIDSAAVESTMTKLLDIMERGQHELRALEPPAGDHDVIETHFLGPNEAQAEVLRAALPGVRAALQKGDGRAANEAFGEAFEEFRAIAQEQEKWATDYGLTDCVG